MAKWKSQVKTKLPTLQSTAGSSYVSILHIRSRKQLERDFWNAVLFKASCLEFTSIPWKWMAPHYWNPAFFPLYLIHTSLFYILCALEKILLLLWHLLSSPCFSMAFRSLSAIQFIYILVPLLGSIPFCQLSACFRWLVFGGWGTNKLTVSSTAYPLTGNFLLFALDHYSSNSFSRTT